MNREGIEEHNRVDVARLHRSHRKSSIKMSILGKPANSTTEEVDVIWLSS